MKILQEYEVSRPTETSVLFFLLCAVIIIFMLLYVLYETKLRKKYPGIVSSSLVVLLGIATVVSGIVIYPDIIEMTSHNRMRVLIEEKVDLMEFLERYKIISIEGETLVLEPLELDNSLTLDVTIDGGKNYGNAKNGAGKKNGTYPSEGADHLNYL